MTPKPGKLLSLIHSPLDLRKLSQQQLVELSDELRSFILDVISVNPGHLGASLGVVELTIALHYIFNTPDDQLIWDVGHQAYAHKILTGRQQVFDSLRKLDGISGFPVRNESPFDSFGTGHASTALSAATGMAVAARLSGNTQRHHIAVVGDGAMTGGMFFEALNHAGGSDLNLLIVLNDNGISIDKSAGILKDYLSRLRQKETDEKETLFAAFGIQYHGPVDGNKLDELIPALTQLQQQKGVKLLHLVTKKGKGFERAEREQVLFHAPGVFDRNTGITIASNYTGKVLYQQVFGQSLLELAQLNPLITAITPAMPTGSALMPMMEAFPDRVFDVDIAEQHALTFAAGLAVQGFTPFCVVYSTFLQRAYDQLIHDIALQKLPVVICIDRAGLVGEDGATHHGAFDMAYLRCIPGISIAAPMNANELRNLMFTAQNNPSGPFAIRYPRGLAPDTDWNHTFESIPFGKGRRLTTGNKIALVSIGHAGNFAAEAIQSLNNEGINPGHYDLRFLKPLDESMLHEVFSEYHTVITIEDGVINGGMGSALLEWANSHGYYNPLIRLGIPDTFIPHGKPDELYRLCGFDANSLVSKVRELWINML